MKKIKGLVCVALVAMLVLGMGVSVFASGKIYVDLNEVVSDTPSQIINNYQR